MSKNENVRYDVRCVGCHPFFCSPYSREARWLLCVLREYWILRGFSVHDFYACKFCGFKRNSEKLVMGVVTSSLASKLAFFPPTPPTYDIVTDQVTGKLKLSSKNLLKNVEVMWIKTKRKQEIAAQYITQPRAKLTILYSHGNAADLGQMHDLLVELSSTLRVNVLGYGVLRWLSET